MRGSECMGCRVRENARVWRVEVRMCGVRGSARVLCRDRDVWSARECKGAECRGRDVWCTWDEGVKEQRRSRCRCPPPRQRPVRGGLREHHDVTGVHRWRIRVLRGVLIAP